MKNLKKSMNFNIQKNVIAVLSPKRNGKKIGNGPDTGTVDTSATTSVITISHF